MGMLSIPKVSTSCMEMIEDCRDGEMHFDVSHFDPEKAEGEIRYGVDAKFSWRSDEGIKQGWRSKKGHIIFEDGFTRDGFTLRFTTFPFFLYGFLAL